MESLACCMILSDDICAQAKSIKMITYFFSATLK